MSVPAPASRTPRPQVSIVVPSYQQGQFIGATLDSLFGQGVDALEVIVIDGGSTDATLDVLRTYGDEPRLRWQSEPDAGQSDAINKGLRLARGTVHAFVNSDDLLLPGALREALAYLDAHPQTDLVSGDGVYVDEAGTPTRRIVCPPFDLVRLIERRTWVLQPATFWRARVTARLGGLNPTLRYCLDYDFWMRAALNGFRFVHVRRVWAAYRLHAASKTVAEQTHFWDEERRQLDVLLALDEAAALRPHAARLYGFLALDHAHRSLLLGERDDARRRLATLMQDAPVFVRAVAALRLAQARLAPPLDRLASIAAYALATFPHVETLVRSVVARP